MEILQCEENNNNNKKNPKPKPKKKNPLRVWTWETSRAFAFRHDTESEVKHSIGMASEVQIIWLETSHWGPDGSLTPPSLGFLWLGPPTPVVPRVPKLTLLDGAWEMPWVPQIFGTCWQDWSCPDGAWWRGGCFGKLGLLSTPLQRPRDARPWGFWAHAYRGQGMPRNGYHHTVSVPVKDSQETYTMPKFSVVKTFSLSIWWTKMYVGKLDPKNELTFQVLC